MKNTKVTFLKNVLLCFISFLMLLSLGNILIRVNHLIHKNQEVSETLKSLQEEKNELEETVKNLKNPDYVVQYAREKYIVTREGEDVIKLPDKNQTNTSNRGE